MISSVKLKNFGPLKNIEWNELGKINIIIGPNGVGKTFLLKSIYSAVKCIEQNGRGNENKNIQELLFDKLYWVFQPYKIGDIVNKPGNNQLEFSISDTKNRLSFSFGQDTIKKIDISERENWSSPEINSIFTPAKEVISIQNTILKSRIYYNEFGFDDTYYDLAKVLIKTTTNGKNIPEFAEASRKIQDIIGGRIVYDSKRNEWIFKKGNLKFTMGVTAEGIKKLSTLDILLQRNYISKNSRIFIDEPEASLLPRAVSDLMDIITVLSMTGIQFFIATHSYYVIKKLHINATKNKISMPIISFLNEDIEYGNLLNGMPENCIIDESVRLYEEEIEVAFQ